MSNSSLNQSRLHLNPSQNFHILPEMSARKSKLASSVQDLTIEMPREYLEHALCKQVNNQYVEAVAVYVFFLC